VDSLRKAGLDKHKEANTLIDLGRVANFVKHGRKPKFYYSKARNLATKLEYDELIQLMDTLKI
jgi:hypothetical protein